MRRLIIAVVALLALSAPALADELSDAKAFIKSANLSTKADLLMWCGVAFSISAATIQDATEKKTATNLADALLTQAAAALLTAGVKNDDLGKLGADYDLVIKSEIVDHLAAPEHTQEECMAAAKNV